ncbi:MAG: cytochrome P450 [Chloroflexota bacterium]
MEPNTQPLIEFDPYSTAFKTDPFPMLATMRRDVPIYQEIDKDGKHRIWTISRHADVEAILRDHKRFVSNYRSLFPQEASDEPEPRSQVENLISDNMLGKDGHDHARLRTLVSKAFTNRMVQTLRPRIQAFADELLDQVVEQNEMDLVDAFALPLPIMVILEMLGIPVTDRDRVRAWSQALIDPAGQAQEEDLIQELLTYLGELFTTRRRAPQDDVISAMVQAEESGDRLSESELYSMVLLLIIAGHETTVKLIATGTLTLLQHPDQLARLHTDPALINSAIEELLRYCGPTDLAKSRFATEDVEIGGHLIRRGDRVRLLINSANRDEVRFNAADTFDITRQHNRHLGFGLGIHFCLGAPLARQEAEIAITTLLGRLPNLQLAVPIGEVEWDLHSFVYGVKHLPVAWG